MSSNRTKKKQSLEVINSVGAWAASNGITKR